MDIVSLKSLIQALNQSTASNHAKLLKNLNIPLSDFERFATWDNKGYTRNCIYRNDSYELILLCWNKDDATPIHSHDGQNCWVYQIQGELTEIRYEKVDGGDLIETNRTILDEGKLSFMNKKMGYHKLSNITEGRAMTLHAYVLPINSCEYFCEEDQFFKTKDLQYDSLREAVLSEN